MLWAAALGLMDQAKRECNVCHEASLACLRDRATGQLARLEPIFCPVFQFSSLQMLFIDVCLGRKGYNPEILVSSPQASSNGNWNLPRSLMLKPCAVRGGACLQEQDFTVLL